MAAGKEYPLSIIISTIDRSTAALRSIGSKFEKLGKKMEGIGKKAGEVGKKLTTNLTLPIVGLGVASVKAMADFEDGMSNVSTLVDTSTESMDEMSKKVLEISRRTPVAIEDLTSALFDTRSAGVSAADAMEVLERSAQLGVAGLGTTAEAVDLVTSSINAFGLEGEKADKVYDNIFKTTKNGKTTISELTQGFGAVAGTVSATGTELDEYLSAVSALTTTGAPAAQVHTQLAAVFAGLTRKTKDTSEVFRKLGAKDLKDLIQKSGGFVPALDRISEALGGNEAKILKLVGSTQAMSAVIGLTGKQGAAFTATLDDMRNKSEAVGEAFDKQNATTSAGLKRTKNAMASAAISIGTILAPVVEHLAEKLQKASEWFENLDDDTKETIVTIAGVVAAVGPALLIFGKMVGAIAAVTKAVRIMGIVMMANPVLALATVIAIAAVMIYDEWELFEEFFELIWDGVKGIFEDAWEFISGIVDKVVGAVDTVIGAASDVKDFATGGPELDVGAAASALQQSITLSGTALGPPALAGGVAPGAGTGAGAGGVSKIEIDIKNAPQGTRVKTASDERAIDVTTGYQMGGDL